MGKCIFGGKLQIDAKNSNFEIFESALYLKSVSMPLRGIGQLQPRPQFFVKKVEIFISLAILTVHFYGINQKILTKKGLFSKFLLILIFRLQVMHDYVHWPSIDYYVK